jgi:hypothetical protein
MILNMMIVTRRSLGEASSLATSCFRLSGSDLNDLTFIEERENRATSEEEKNPEQKRKRSRSRIWKVIKGSINLRYGNRLSIVLREQAQALSSMSVGSRQGRFGC